MIRSSNWSRYLGISAAYVACGVGLGAATSRADVVTDWNATAEKVIIAKGAQFGVYQALVHVAIYDAVNAIDGRYSVFAVVPHSSTRGASKEAAASAAAYRVLLAAFPDQTALLDPAYTTSLAAIPDGAAKAKGVAIGEEVAAAWFATRAGDGRDAVVPYVFGSGPGVYQHTDPGPPLPITPWLAKMKPFGLERASQYRAYGPPDLTSQRYAQDLAMVKSLGALNSTERSVEETEIGLFHTENPGTFWFRNLRDLALAKNLGVAANARLFAELSVGMADTLIACWDSKYYFNAWRPVTAIRAADTDDNVATAADPAWAPLATTPPHPEYPAAHGCAVGAVSTILDDFFGTKNVRMTFKSTVPGTVPHVFSNTEQLVDEIEMARVFGGMHFPTSVEHGVQMGRKVARWELRHYFKPKSGR